MVSRFVDYITAFPLHVYYTPLTDTRSGKILYETYACELDSTERKILEKLQKVETAVREGKR